LIDKINKNTLTKEKLEVD